MAYYEGYKYRLVAVATSGDTAVLDVASLDADDAKAFVADQNGKGTPVQAYRSYWKEEALPYAFYPANPTNPA